MKVDMSPEAVTNRLEIMEQLWELSVNLMNAKDISEAALLSEKSLGKDWQTTEENEAWKEADKFEAI